MPSEKKEHRQKKINDDFRKVVISDKMQEERISVLRKKRAKRKSKITTTLGTSLFMIQHRTRCAIYIPLMQKTSQ